MAHQEAIMDITSFLWAVFAADVSYVFLAAAQRFVSGSYPATRHHVDSTSIVVIAFHVLCGSIVIWGGSALWLALQAEWTPTVPAWAATTLAAATILHSASNLPLLRKIPGTRLLNVPVYVMVTVYNVCRAVWLLDAPAGEREREFLLLWCGVSTFVWVRCFIYLFVLVTSSSLQDAGSYDLFYSVSLPYAGIFGMIVPLSALGGDPRWFAAFATVAVVAPCMLGIHKFCVTISGWPRVQSSGVCRWVVQSVMDATNPVVYHGQHGSVAQVIPVEAHTAECKV
ncbi:hypothetical protein KC19_7G116700 [Ceratodon purpureus]|uniref:Uncharacterized protein n=1 Tax=Ceratodon purpureus TaxID=3225 RepID=A0A8T0H7G0_CERPU|nr:hypothetical protein KC19_7G116700 [Ceratodon purpureus]